MSAFPAPTCHSSPLVRRTNQLDVRSPRSISDLEVEEHNISGITIATDAFVSVPTTDDDMEPIFVANSVPKGSPPAIPVQADSHVSDDSMSVATLDLHSDDIIFIEPENTVIHVPGSQVNQPLPDVAMAMELSHPPVAMMSPSKSPIHVPGRGRRSLSFSEQSEVSNKLKTSSIDSAEPKQNPIEMSRNDATGNTTDRRHRKKYTKKLDPPSHRKKRNGSSPGNFQETSRRLSLRGNKAGTLPPQTSSSGCKVKDDVENLCMGGPVWEDGNGLFHSVLRSPLKLLNLSLCSVLDGPDGGGSPSLSRMREGMEREKLKRMHCEQVIEDLQQKLLRTEQDLTVARAQGKQKDANLARLQQTLEKLGEAWRRLEVPRLEALKLLEVERDDALHKVDVYTQKVKELEGALSATREAFVTKDGMHQREVATLIKKTVELELQSQQAKELFEEKNSCEVELREQVKQLQEQLLKEQELCLRCQSESETNQTSLQRQFLEEQCMKLDAEKAAMELRLKVAETESEIQRLQTCNDELGQTKVHLEEELKRSEAQCLSANMTCESLQNEMDSVKALAQKNVEALEEKWRKKHEQELTSLASSYEHLIVETECNHRREVGKLEADGQRRAEDASARLEAAESEIKSLKNDLTKMQLSRSRIMSRLHNFLQDQWKEALVLLYDGAESGSEFPDHWKKLNWLSTAATDETSAMQGIQNNLFGTAKVEVANLKPLDVIIPTNRKIGRCMKSESDKVATFLSNHSGQNRTGGDFPDRIDGMKELQNASIVAASDVSCTCSCSCYGSLSPPCLDVPNASKTVEKWCFQQDNSIPDSGMYSNATFATAHTEPFPPISRQYSCSVLPNFNQETQKKPQAITRLRWPIAIGHITSSLAHQKHSTDTFGATVLNKEQLAKPFPEEASGNQQRQTESPASILNLSDTSLYPSLSPMAPICPLDLH